MVSRGITTNELRAAMSPSEPVPFWVEILLEAAQVTALVGAGKAAEHAREQGAELLERAHVWSSLGARPNLRERALMSLGRVSAETMDLVLEGFASVGEKGAMEAVKAPGERVGEAEKDAVLEVLASFHDQMAITFQRARENVPSYALSVGDDAILLAWWHMADAAGPLRPSVWREFFTQKIARFKAAGLTQSVPDIPTREG